MPNNRLEECILVFANARICDSTEFLATNREFGKLSENLKAELGWKPMPWMGTGYLQKTIRGCWLSHGGQSMTSEAGFVRAGKKGKNLRRRYSCYGCSSKRSG